MSFLFLFAFMRLFVLFVLVKFYGKKKKSKITPNNLIHYTTNFLLMQKSISRNQNQHSSKGGTFTVFRIWMH